MANIQPFFNTYLRKTILFLNNSPIYTAGDVTAENAHQNKYKPYPCHSIKNYSIEWSMEMCFQHIKQLLKLNKHLERTRY